MMRDRESGRLILDNITLVEYENADNTLAYFIQCGIAGFHAKPEELKSIHALLSYYYNMEEINNTVMSIQGETVRFQKAVEELEKNLNQQEQ